MRSDPRHSELSGVIRATPPGLRGALLLSAAFINGLLDSELLLSEQALLKSAISRFECAHTEYGYHEGPEAFLEEVRRFHRLVEVKMPTSVARNLRAAFELYFPWFAFQFQVGFSIVTLVLIEGQ